MGDAPARVDRAPVLVHGLAVAVDEAVRPTGSASLRTGRRRSCADTSSSGRSAPALEIALDHQPFRLRRMPGGAELRPADHHAGELARSRCSTSGRDAPVGENRNSSTSRKAIQRASWHVAPQQCSKAVKMRPRAPVVPEERARPRVHDHDVLGDVGGEHLLGDRPRCRCRTGKIARRRSAGGTRSTPAGTRRRRGRSRRPRGRFRCARRASLPPRLATAGERLADGRGVAGQGVVG